VTDVAKHVLAITEANLKSSFEYARKLMQAKDISEVMQLQSDFLRNQFGVATEQFKQMTGGATSAAEDVSIDKPESI
jgi:phasin family protein